MGFTDIVIAGANATIRMCGMTNPTYYISQSKPSPRPCEELKMESGKWEIVTVYYYSELDSKSISFIGYIFWLVGATTSLMFFWIASHSLAMT